MELKRAGQGTHDGRSWLVGAAPDLASVAAELEPPSPHFVLFLAADCRGIPGATLVDIASDLIERGASYVCCWGPDAVRLEHAFDEAGTLQDVASGRDPGDDVLMTTSHEGESLEDALWFAAWSTYPTPRYQAGTQSLVAVAVANADWHRETASFLTAGAPMRDEA